MSVKTKSAASAKDRDHAASPIDYTPMEYDAFLAKLGTKDRLNVERHVAACDLEPDPAHSHNYRRLVCALAGMAPHAAKTHGQQAVQIYIPDGKYRMQVFALQDQRDGLIMIFCDDVLDVALKAGLISGPHEVAEQNNSYRLPNGVDSIKVDQLDGKTANPSPFYKDMLGWNRRAIRITLPANATPAQVKAAETLCAIGAKKWQAKIEKPA